MSDMSVNEVTINGVNYIRKDSLNDHALASTDGLPYVVIRTYSAGVHIGFLKSREKTEVVLVNSRRVHYWEGAASLSQLALEGVKKPGDCRISVVVPEILLTEAVEVIPVTEAAKKNLDAVPVWRV